MTRAIPHRLSAEFVNLSQGTQSNFNRVLIGLAFCFMGYMHNPNSRRSATSHPQLMRCSFCRKEINVQYKTAFALASR